MIFLDSFLQLQQNQISQQNFSLLHTNISSLSGNFDKLELLLTQIDHKFNIISVTETWDNTSSNKNLGQLCMDGYNKFIGQKGTTLKSGCGFFISTKVNFIPRKDLDKHLYIYNQTNEFECKWIEVINKNKPNSVIASIYRHPSKNDEPF